MSSPQTKLMQAFALHQQGQLAQAKILYEQIVVEEPNHAEALHLLGVIAIDAKDYQYAISLIEKAMTIKPGNAIFYCNHAIALQALERWEEAIESYDRAIAIKADYAIAYFKRGIALQNLKQFEAAIESYNHAINIKPDNAEAYFKRGFVLQNLKQFEAAVDSFDYFIKLKPGHAEAYINRGNSLRGLQRLVESVESFDQAIMINPRYADAYFNRGLALHELKLLEKAIASYDHAIAINPDHVEARWGKSLALLSAGDFEKGWELYEWRSKREKIKFQPIPITKPWDGEKMNGSLLVLSEQGIGDQIFYASLLNDLPSLVDNVTVFTEPRLVSLYQRSFKQIEFISEIASKSVQEFDAQIYMPSLGRYFRPNLQVLQNVKTPYLKADSKKTQNLRDRLSRDKKLICGLSWVSTNAEMGACKTLRLRELTSVLKLPDIDFIDLQYGDTTDEQQVILEETGLKLTKIPEVDNFHDIDGLAALIDACDIVLTVSNTTAHIAGALGKKMIIMLPYAKGLLWYWHQGSGKSHWYPTATLICQPTQGDWISVIEAVKHILEAVE